VLLFVGSCIGAPQCFPLTRGWGTGPNGLSRQDWWCGSDAYSGFLGFSYPTEDDCSGYSYDSFLADFQKQKTNYGATFVRIYLPVCRQTSFWVNLVKACRDSSLALIPMIFWDWQQNDQVMYEAENAFLGVFSDSEVGSIAPYIIHSVEFGDELGEQGDYWIPLMQDFKNKLAKYQIPITISDDWDRDVYQDGNGGLSDFGKQVNDLSDMTHEHDQPFYHPDVVIDAFHFWDYFLAQMQFLVNNNKRPIFISQTLWAYNKDGHQRGEHDEADTMPNYINYFNTINDNCQTIKSMNVSWFFHTWFGEPGLDLIGGDGQPVYPFVPKFC